MEQKIAYAEKPAFFPGMLTRAENRVVEQFLAGDDNIEPGMVVMIKSTDKSTVYPFSPAYGAKANANDTIVGIALTARANCVMPSTYDAKANYSKGTPVDVLIKGSTAVLIKKACKKGQYLHIKQDNGDLDVDDSTTKANHKFTGFKIVETLDAVNAGQLVEVSNTVL